jgi:8-oxo-dGTP pyrophosphatase MutT (NUDIX family)
VVGTVQRLYLRAGGLRSGYDDPMKPDRQTLHYDGRVIRVTTDEVVLPNGHRTLLEVVHHPGGAAVVALNGDDHVCLLRQYRYVADGWLWELPAGKLEAGEPPLQTAQRELAEEAGMVASDWHNLECVLSSPGVFAERLYLFMATGLNAVSTAHERSEVIEIHWVPLEQACAWALDGTIADCKTVIGLLRAHALRAGTPAGKNP